MIQILHYMFKNKMFQWFNSIDDNSYTGLKMHVYIHVYIYIHTQGLTVNSRKSRTLFINYDFR